MQRVAIIPARGGSKGLPRKNLLTVGGIPLVARSVLAARRARSIDRVYVSTEDAEIAEVADRYGADVIYRPDYLATDETLTIDVVMHAVQRTGNPDLVVVLQCTSPLTEPRDIDLAVRALEANPSAGGLISVHPDKAFIFDEAGTCLTYGPEALPGRRQDRKPRYRANGAIFVVRTPVETLWPEDPVFLTLPSARSIDIDTPRDLALAELMLREQYPDEWIVLGSGPDAAETLPLARMNPATLITTNSGLDLAGEPDVYLLFDQIASRQYSARAYEAAERGTHLVTARRQASALATRGVDRFHEFLEMNHTDKFAKGEYSCTLSGLICLQYALNHGARRIHLVGMNGYRGVINGDHFDGHEPPSSPLKRRQHTETIIRPYIQAAVTAHPDVEFIFYGELNYHVHGANTSQVVESRPCNAS